MFAIYLLLSIYTFATYLQGATLCKSIFRPVFWKLTFFFLRFQKQTRPHAAYLIIAYDVAVINLEIQIWVLKYGFSRFLTDRERFAQQPNFNYVRQIEVFWAMIQYS